MATGADAFPTHDLSVVPPIQEAPAHPFVDAGAALSSQDSQSSYRAMKPADQAAKGVTDLQIVGEDNPYANLTQTQRQEILTKVANAAQTGDTAAEAAAVHLPSNATERQVDEAEEKVVDAMQPTFHTTEAAKHNALALQKSGETKLFTDMTTEDPKQAKLAAEHYFDAVFKDQSPKTLSDLRDQFHMFRGDIDAATDLMGISTPVSVPVMNAMGNLLDKRAPRESAAQKAREENQPSIAFQIRSGQL